MGENEAMPGLFSQNTNKIQPVKSSILCACCKRSYLSLSRWHWSFTHRPNLSDEIVPRIVLCIQINSTSNYHHNLWVTAITTAVNTMDFSYVYLRCLKCLVSSLLGRAFALCCSALLREPYACSSAPWSYLSSTVVIAAIYASSWSHRPPSASECRSR